MTPAGRAAVALLAAAALAGPVSAQSAHRTPGDSLDVALLTIGPGAEVWEKFGHNAIVIVDRATGEIFMGRVPSYSVVVPGSLPGKPLPGRNETGPSLACAVIVKRVDAQTRSKTSINELLRD